MMRIETKLFGPLDVQESDLYQFVPGLLGFEELKQFALIQPDKTLPFAYLQAVEEPSVSLLVADPFAFRHDYEFDLADADLEALGQPLPEQITVWVTVAAKGTLEEATANLMAPILLNTALQIARQVVLHDSGYQSRTPLIQSEGGSK